MADASKGKARALSTIGQYQVAAFALYQLGGDTRRIDTEDIAVKCHELAPGRFCWAKHPEQVNLELVRVALSDAKKKAKGALVLGSGRTGWSLTPAGLEWARLMSPVNLAPGAFSDGRMHGPKSPRVIRKDRERARILASDAWASWAGGVRPVPRTEWRDLLRIDSYATPDELTAKATRILALFQDDPELAEFVKALAELATSMEARRDA